MGLRVQHGQIQPYKKSYTWHDYTPWARKWGSRKQSNLGELPPCTFGTPIVEYLNSADVKEALHIPTEYPAWELCTSYQEKLNDTTTYFYTRLPIGS